MEGVYAGVKLAPVLCWDTACLTHLALQVV